MPKRFIILGFAIGFFTLTTLFSQENKGCISEKMLVDLQKSFQNTTSDKAILNAIANNDINKLALNLSNSDLNDTYFSHKVKTKGITNQKSSGRCWMFSGMNILRAKFIAKYNPEKFEFSQNYLFFWDQLEKSNLFLQAVIDTRNKTSMIKPLNGCLKIPLATAANLQV